MDKDGSKFSGVWSRAVRLRYRQEVTIALLANLSSVPGLMHGFVRKKFLSKDPAHSNGRILLDWQGLAAHRFGFRDNVANVYVIDRDGILRYKGSVQGTDADLEPLFGILDSLVNIPTRP